MKKVNSSLVVLLGIVCCYFSLRYLFRPLEPHKGIPVYHYHPVSQHSSAYGGNAFSGSLPTFSMPSISRQRSVISPTAPITSRLASAHSEASSPLYRSSAAIAQSYGGGTAIVATASHTSVGTAPDAYPSAPTTAVLQPTRARLLAQNDRGYSLTTDMQDATLQAAGGSTIGEDDKETPAVVPVGESHGWWVVCMIAYTLYLTKKHQTKKIRRTVK